MAANDVVKAIVAAIDRDGCGVARAAEWERTLSAQRSLRRPATAKAQGAEQLMDAIARNLPRSSVRPARRPARRTAKGGRHDASRPLRPAAAAHRDHARAQSD